MQRKEELPDARICTVQYIIAPRARERSERRPAHTSRRARVTRFGVTTSLLCMRGSELQTFSAPSYMPEIRTLVRGGRRDRLWQTPRESLRTTKTRDAPGPRIEGSFVAAGAAVATGGASQPFFALAVIPASVLTRRTCFFSLGVYTRLDWIGMFSPICIAPPVYHVPLYAYSCR